MELSTLIDQYLEHLKKKKNASHYTLKNYTYYLNHFLEYTNSQKITKVSGINEELIHRFKIHLSKLQDQRTATAFKKTTQNYFLIALRNFLWFVKEVKGINAIQAEEVYLHKQIQKRPKTLDEDTLKALLNAPSLDLAGLRDRAILAVLSATGIKISEASSLNRNFFSFSNQTISIPGKRERILDIPSSTVSSLENYLKARKDSFKPLFIRFKGQVDPSLDGEHMRLTPRSIERMVKKYTESIGVSMEITPQILRHSFALSLLDQGEKIDTVQKVMGHTSKASTQVYEKLMRGNL